MFLVEDKINKNNLESVTYAYQRFFADLYGTLTPERASEAINQVNIDHILKVLCLYGDDNKLLAIARFRVKDNEQITSDIVCIEDESVNRKLQIYLSMISKLEDLATEENLDISFLEVPKFDKTLAFAAEEHGYDLVPDDGLKHFKYVRTILMNKKLRELESGQYYGWHRLNK